MSSKPLFFYGHSGQKACLSNWYSVSFTDDNNIKFANNEQYMMYQKAILFKDMEIAKEILKEPNPMVCKKFGRKVKNFDEVIWQKNCMAIVGNGCYLKFSQNQELKDFLLSTGDRLLVEASPYDKIWGIGLNERAAQKIPENEWPGQNLLGKCLMKVRKMLEKK